MNINFRVSVIYTNIRKPNSKSLFSEEQWLCTDMINKYVNSNFNYHIVGCHKSHGLQIPKPIEVWAA